jgi:hypothetical protein
MTAQLVPAAPIALIGYRPWPCCKLQLQLQTANCKTAKTTNCKLQKPELQ